MNNINELNVNSIYDYLVYSKTHKEVYKLVIIISNKQVVIGTRKRNMDDHWDMIVKMNKMMYPDRKYNDVTISNDTFIFTSLGNDLEVEIPEKVSERQLEEVKNILRQVKQFEFEYDTYLYMPYESHDIVNESIEKLTDNISSDIDEVIIGKEIVEGKNR
jgi:hypothetical protein